MLMKNRVRLFCHKVLPNGMMDKFSVMVAKCNKDAAISEYRQQGYKVSVTWEGT